MNINNDHYIHQMAKDDYIKPALSYTRYFCINNVFLRISDLSKRITANMDWLRCLFRTQIPHSQFVITR